MKKLIPAIFVFSILISCQPMKKADLIVYNAKIYTVNENFEIAEAFAVKDGKFMAIGTTDEILDAYESDNKMDLKGQSIYPGFIDPHCHFYGYGLFKPHADLNGTKSFEEILEIVKQQAEKFDTEWIVGRGWDQNDWPIKEFPDNKALDSLFPDRPVILYRVDGHAVLINQAAFNRIELDTVTYKDYMVYKDGVFTGVLLDNAADIAKEAVSKPGPEEIAQALLRAQDDCFAVGLTGVGDAGLDQDVIQIIDSLQKKGSLKMRMYVMLSPNEKNMAFIKEKGIYKTPFLNIRSIKLYADGALGSRGASLKEDYSDDPGNKGFILYPLAHYEKYCQIAYENNYQICTHAIGDSANKFVLDLYAKYLKGENDRRWRIEHAQIVDPADFHLFGDYNIVASMQSTHATSDMYWAEERIGKERLPGAYALKDLMNENGWIPNGSDFPIESINPLYGFYAAVARQDHEKFPEGGYLPENALSRKEALKAMTLWAAKANFEEHEKGSIEIGKLADFVILEQDIMETDIYKTYQTKVLKTFINGEQVFPR